MLCQPNRGGCLYQFEVSANRDEHNSLSTECLFFKTWSVKILVQCWSNKKFNFPKMSFNFWFFLKKGSEYDWRILFGRFWQKNFWLKFTSYCKVHILLSIWKKQSYSILSFAFVVLFYKLIKFISPYFR